MQKDADSSGLQSGSARDHSNTQSSLWRPWKKGNVDKSALITNCHTVAPPDAKQKTPQVTHPVKLFWPKSRCFDYLYRDAEILLRNYPVQATICPFAESSSDEEDDDGNEEEEEEERVEKEQN
uniref:Ripply transcriptional repressor 2 n=1 Tax=Oryzias latipes TaxID=8090 RepID=A0A3P9M9B7_ORYLA